MKRICDAVEEWPPSSWGGFYSGDNKLVPDTRASTIVCAYEAKGDVMVTVDSNGQEFSAVLQVLDPSDKERVVTALSGATGTSLDQAGDLKL